MILSVCCKRGMLKEAKELLEEMKGKGIEMNRMTYNMLIRAYCRLRWLKEATRTVEVLTASRCLPDLCMYNVLVSGFCKVGRVVEGFRMMEEMERMKVAPDVVTYKTLINEGRFQWKSRAEAFNVFDETREKGLKPELVKHNISFKSSKSAKARGRPETSREGPALALFDDLKEKGLEPDAHTYKMVLCALSEAARSEEAKKILSMMVESGNLPEKFTLSSEQAFPRVEVEKKQEESMGRDANPEEDQNTSSTAICTEHINQLCLKGQFKEAKKAMEEMMKMGIPINSSTYITLMDGFIKRQND